VQVKGDLNGESDQDHESGESAEEWSKEVNGVTR
jgi:hypothetical protein